MNLAARTQSELTDETDPPSIEVEKEYTLSEAFEYCAQITKNHYENFPVASLAIPKKLRPYICAVYAFARAADDFADEKEFEGERMEKLNEWEKQLRSTKPFHPVFIALSETISKFELPTSLFHDLINAFKMDVEINRYQTFSEVINYCRYSANPVGRIILHIMGYPAPKFMEYSDAICTALQLANFWQDVAVDLLKNRIYIPQEDFTRFRYSESDLFEKTYNEDFGRLMAFQVERTEELFEQGKPLLNKAPGRFGFELRLTWLGGMTILKKIRHLKGNIFKERPVLKKWDAPGIILGALRKKNFDKT